MKTEERSLLAQSATVTPSKCVVRDMAYQIPRGIDEDEFINTVKEFTHLAKIKGLTVRQAQLLFDVCSEYILDCTLV